MGDLYNTPRVAFQQRIGQTRFVNDSSYRIAMFDCFETSKTGRRDWVTFAFLLLAIVLPGSGFVGVLAAYSSEAEVEFFGEEEVEECLIVALKQRTRRRTGERPKPHVQNRVVVSRTHHSDVSHQRVITGHRFANGLLAPIRC